MTKAMETWEKERAEVIIVSSNETFPFFDKKTGLLWHADSVGPFVWEKAQEYCTSLGDGWRCPTIKELKNLINWEKHPIAPPDFLPTYYWSCNTHLHFTSYAWCIYLVNGSIYAVYKSLLFYVRAVRNERGSVRARES